MPTTMARRTWLITGVSSGFGRELARQLLHRGDRVVGTVRRLEAVADLAERHPETFRPERLDLTDAAAIGEVVDRSFAELGRVDVVVSNAGYGLFGASEELTDQQVEHVIATNLTGSIRLIRAALPHLRAQGGGRIVRGEAPSRVRVNVVRFAPAARNAWHRHAVGQTVHVTEGVGRIQARDGALLEIRAGDTIATSAGEWHWHGAAPDHFMTHLAIWEAPADGGQETEWGEQVGDQVYAAAPVDATR